MADQETFVKTEVQVDPNVTNQKTPRCPKCGSTERYVTHYAMEKRVCTSCDSKEIGDFNASTIVDGKGLPWRPAKGRTINADGVKADGTAKGLTQAQVEAAKPKKVRTPKPVSEETKKVSKKKVGMIVIEIPVDYLIGKSQAEINMVALEGLHTAIGELPMVSINDAEKILGLRTKVAEIIAANKKDGGK